MSDNCLFCKIVSGTVATQRIYEDDGVLAFPDIAPQAPVHVLVIPKRHIASLDALSEADRDEMGHLLERTAHVARLLGVHEAGYRTIINTHSHGGQMVFHLHCHILGGKPIGAMVSR
ncbi:MAG: histidine triad nucleotide-binding protein [Magnetococcales bacterium]|nr:histidine triad nucleotide-binding protein [Magnetococcales bacterium]